MWKRELIYKDKRILYFSKFSQKWIDKLFPLDYLLKSLQKRSSTKEGEILNEFRLLLKDSQYSLLSAMLCLWYWDVNLLYTEFFNVDKKKIYEIVQFEW
jgi:hypothetical protein